MNKNQRLCDLEDFYKILGELESRLGNRRRLGDCDGRMGWPQRGVYFFFERGEDRRESGKGSRVVRVGTHATDNRRPSPHNTLWRRLYQHRGKLRSGYGGGSIFRNHVGRSLMARDGRPCSYAWREIQPQKHERDYELEKHISGVIRDMHFLWLAVLDKPGPDSERGYIERNAIALLSNHCKKHAVDAPSQSWLGKCQHTAYQNGAPADNWTLKAAKSIHDSGLWNVKHVNEEYDRRFLDRLKHFVDEMR